MEPTTTTTDHVYIKDDAKVWVEAKIVERGAETVTVAIVGDDPQQQQQQVIPLKDYEGYALPQQNPVLAPPDMTELTYLHEPAVLRTLQERYCQDQPYTRCGDIIVSVNPFQWSSSSSKTNLYDTKTRNAYANAMVWRTTATDPRAEIAPHVFEVRSSDGSNNNNNNRNANSRTTYLPAFLF